MTHQFVVPSNGQVERSDSETISLGGIEDVKAEYFKKFDYCALGHIHKPQKVKGENIRYSGSILKYSFSEAHDLKSGILIEVEDEIKLTSIPLVPIRDMREIKGKLETLVSDEVSSLENKDDYLKVTITNEEPLYNVIDVLRKVYPNVLCVEFSRNAKNDNNIEYADLNKLKELDTIQLCSDFYKEQNNVNMSKKCEKLLEKTIKKVKEED